jgi:hypothetical protein
VLPGGAESGDIDVPLCKTQKAVSDQALGCGIHIDAVSFQADPSDTLLSSDSSNVHLTRFFPNRGILALGLTALLILILFLVIRLRELHVAGFDNRTATPSSTVETVPFQRSFFVPGAQQHRQKGTLSDEAEVRSRVLYWARSWKEHEFGPHVSCYAPYLRTYFTQHNVPIGAVIRDKANFARRYPSVREYDVSDIGIDFESRTRAVASFRKRWDVAGTSSFSGEEIEQLTLQRSGRQWLIISEQELKVIKRKKQGH